jgi:cytochrome c oxidase subunit II
VPFRPTFTQLFSQDTVIAWVVFGLIVATLLVALVRGWHRRRTGQNPSSRAEANKLELGYLTVLIGISVYLVVASLTANARDSAAIDPPKPVMRVNVNAFQWCWEFQYAGQQVTVTAPCQGGPIPTLVLPTGQPVELDITSTDVIHAFWVPYLEYKTYAYPDHINRFTVTLPRAGSWIGRCAQICGVYHYEMDFHLQAVPPARFDYWLRTHRGLTTDGSGA